MDVFNVLTEFRFDAGTAILESQKLQNAVEGISTAADKTTLAFERLGAGIVGHIDILHGGMIGGLLKAIEASDQFNLNASTFANIIQANMKHMTGSVDTFNDRLAASKEILMDIHNVAFKFGLDEKALFGAAQGIGATLAPHGLAGTNFNTAIDMARMSLKAAPALQMEPRNVEQELIRVVTGQANSNETLFRRLVSDTQSLKQYQTLGTGAFNALPIAKRVELLQKALNEFSRDTEVAEFNMRSLHNQLTLLQNAFTGLASILKPIGDLLLPIVQKSLMAINKYLETNARQAIQNLATTIEPFFRDPTRTMAGIMGLHRLPHDIHVTKKVMEVFTGLRFLEWGLDMFHIKLGVISKALDFFGKHIFPEHKASAFLGNVGKTFMGEGPGIAGLAKGFLGAAGEIIGSMASILVILQIFSKGVAYAKMWDLEFIANHMVVLSSIFQKFSLAIQKFFLPISNGIDALARLVGWFLSFGWITDHVLTGLDSLGSVFEFIADMVTEMSAVFAALGNVLSYLIANIMQLNFSGISKEGISEAFFGGFKQFLSENLLTKTVRGWNGLDQDKNVGKSVTNIGKIEMRLDFKENMQPDRVAFTIVDQLKKVAQNPSQGRGNTFATHALTGAGGG